MYIHRETPHIIINLRVGRYPRVRGDGTGETARPACKVCCVSILRSTTHLTPIADAPWPWDILSIHNRTLSSKHITFTHTFTPNTHTHTQSIHWCRPDRVRYIVLQTLPYRVGRGDGICIRQHLAIWSYTVYMFLTMISLAREGRTNSDISRKRGSAQTCVCWRTHKLLCTFGRFRSLTRINGRVMHVTACRVGGLWVAGGEGIQALGCNIRQGHARRKDGWLCTSFFVSNRSIRLGAEPPAYVLHIPGDNRCALSK